MKTLIQKIHLSNNESFACRTYTTPNFETNWHKHEEYELILITQGFGTALIGDYINEYKKGDVYFIASNLPHWFRKGNNKMIGSAIVVHFGKHIFESEFLNIPEMSKIKNLLSKQNGLSIQKKLKTNISELIKKINESTSFDRLQLLLTSLQSISTSNQYVIITKDFSVDNSNTNQSIETIINFTFKNFTNPITLEQVAKIANMTIPTFCRFFKKNIKKSYFDFLQEVRISHACKLLHSTEKSILEICYESGYNSWSHFSKQFKVVKKITPTAYRKNIEL